MGERAPRGPATYRQRDLEVAIRTAKANGCSRVEVDKEGRIVIIIASDEKPEPARNPWDEALP